MKPIDIALAVAVAVTWGLGFVASRIALDDVAEAAGACGSRVMP